MSCEAHRVAKIHGAPRQIVIMKDERAPNGRTYSGTIEFVQIATQCWNCQTVYLYDPTGQRPGATSRLALSKLARASLLV